MKKMYSYEIKSKKVRDNYNFMVDALQQNMFDDNEVKQEYEKFSSLCVIEYLLNQLTFKKGQSSHIETKDKNIFDWLGELKEQLVDCEMEH